MLVPNSAKPAAEDTANGLRKRDQLGGKVDFIAKPKKKLPQAIINGKLTGSNCCTALGIIATGPSPVISLCRMLIAAGHDPGLPLHAFRGDTLCLTVYSICEAAKLDINGKSSGFKKRSAAVGIAPLARQNGGRHLPSRIPVFWQRGLA